MLGNQEVPSYLQEINFNKKQELSNETNWQSKHTLKKLSCGIVGKAATCSAGIPYGDQFEYRPLNF